LKCNGAERAPRTDLARAPISQDTFMSLCANACIVVAPLDPNRIDQPKPGPSELTFQRVYDESFRDVQRWIRAFGGRPADVADLAQDVFVIAFRRLPEFDGQSVAGWLYQITRRKMRDYRRLSWVKHFFTARTPSAFESPAMSADQLVQIENGEKQVLLDRILNRLPAEQRAAFVLFELEGLSGAEIAEVQQVPVNTVWARIHRARHKLQSLVSHQRRQF
jgi:RNA polymerase sigma-70 factor, ECF subfamily